MGTTGTCVGRWGVIGALVAAGVAAAGCSHDERAGGGDMSACDADAAEREPAIEVPSCAAGERCVLVTDSSGCECTVTWSCAAGWEGHAIVGGGGAGSDGGGGSPTCRQACEGDADCVDGYREDASLVTDVAETGSNCAPLRAIGWCTGTGSDGAGEMTCARACDHLPTPVCVEDDAA